MSLINYQTIIFLQDVFASNVTELHLEYFIHKQIKISKNLFHFIETFSFYMKSFIRIYSIADTCTCTNRF